MPDEELTLEPTGKKPRRKAAPRTRRTPAERMASDNPVERVFGAFEQAFQARYHFPVIVSDARDRSILKRLVEQWGEADVLALVDQFFSATRPGGRGYQEIRRLRWHNVADFSNGAQILRRLNGAGPGGDLHERTASNVDEVAKALGRDRR